MANSNEDPLYVPDPNENSTNIMEKCFWTCVLEKVLGQELLYEWSLGRKFKIQIDEWMRKFLWVLTFLWFYWTPVQVLRIGNFSRNVHNDRDTYLVFKIFACEIFDEVSKTSWVIGKEYAKIAIDMYRSLNLGTYVRLNKSYSKDRRSLER